MESEKINARDVFICICCSYIRALHMILDCSWEEIFEGLVIATSSDSSKCSYHLLYAPALLIDYQELKQFTKLVHKLTGEKYDKFIDMGLPGRNFNLRLIGSAKKDRVKRILKFSLDNGWDELDHARVQPPLSAKFEVKPHILSVEKINQKKIIVGQNSLKKYANLVMQEYSNYLGGWDIEEKDSQYFVYFSRKAYMQNHNESGKIFNDPYIAEKIQQKNKNNITPPVIHKVKEIPAWAKCDSFLTATEVYEERYVKPLLKEGDVYVGSGWETGKTYTLEHLTIPDAINLLALSTQHTYSSAITVRLNLKSYCDIETKDINLPDYQRVVCQIEIVSVNDQAQTCLAGWSREQLEQLYKLIHDGKQFSVIHNTYQPQKGKTFRLAPNKETVLAELWEWAKQMSSLSPNERKSASLICHLRRDVQGIVYALRVDFPELRIKKYHGKSDPIEKAGDFSNVEEAWKNIDLVVYNSTLKIGVSCTNLKFKQVFCLFNSYIETNAGTNQMLFRMRYIKDYICYIEQRASNVPITEEELFNWLLKAKQECLPQELQNRGIFPDIESIIRNKDIPTIRLWVAYMLEKF
ncbi:hypothetical protein Glove_40g139 [Diversispora epigaea]|uniref:Replication origin-binding protein domain-containing protein n=1 Tax=Diversispora epigaea TaxID=1348612 RepID=A0A397JQ68_9GLOM|nr:hypothetical protein Glove_40g139 [Diversispora epigaea]